MTVIHESFIGTSSHPRYFTVLETPYGMILREGRFARRIVANELSFDFIVEIAESTLPFQNVANLLENIIIRHEWTSENCNLKAVCQMVIEACNMVADYSKPPATGRCKGEFDARGRGIKRYPHTYECILRPHMVEVYKKQDTYKQQEVWQERVDRDSSPRVMERRVKAAEKDLPF